MLMDKVTIMVPSSSANVGLGYDVWCLGLEEPCLQLTYTRSALPMGITIEAKSAYAAPEGRVLGHAGRKALEQFLSDYDIHDGAYLNYTDNGYPVGGLGRSGAEAVAAIMAAAVLYQIHLSR